MCSTPRDLRYALAAADASFKSTMQARGMDWVARSNGRGQIARSTTVEEAKPPWTFISLRFGVIASTTVATRLLRRGRRKHAGLIPGRRISLRISSILKPGAIKKMLLRTQTKNFAFANKFHSNRPYLPKKT